MKFAYKTIKLRCRFHEVLSRQLLECRNPRLGEELKARHHCGKDAGIEA